MKFSRLWSYPYLVPRPCLYSLIKLWRLDVFEQSTQLSLSESFFLCTFSLGKLISVMNSDPFHTQTAPRSTYTAQTFSLSSRPVNRVSQETSLNTRFIGTSNSVSPAELGMFPWQPVLFQCSLSQWMAPPCPWLPKSVTWESSMTSLTMVL